MNNTKTIVKSERIESKNSLKNKGHYIKNISHAYIHQCNGLVSPYDIIMKYIDDLMMEEMIEKISEFCFRIKESLGSNELSSVSPESPFKKCIDEILLECRDSHHFDTVEPVYISMSDVKTYERHSHSKIMDYIISSGNVSDEFIDGILCFENKCR